MKGLYKHLSEKDIDEGKDLIEAFEMADEEGKKAILIYAGCLKDIAMLKKTKQTA